MLSKKKTAIGLIILIVVLTMVLTVVGCKQEPCEQHNTGNLTIYNQTSQVITVEIDGDFAFTVDPGEQQTHFDLSAGTHQVKGTATNGLWVDTVDIVQCSTKTLNFQ